MKAEYNALRALRDHPGWPILSGLWALQHQKIVLSMRKAGKRGTESSWRYYAGQQEGFELALMQLDRSLADMDKDDENLEASREATEQVEALLKKIKGEDK